MNSNSLRLQIAQTLTFFALCSLAWPSIAQKKMRFERQTTAEGLSHNAVNCILQDNRGFVWLGTLDGLNLWDGNTFTVFRHDDKDSTSLSHSYVWSAHQDKQGRLWFGTLSGLNLYDPRTKTFQRFNFIPKHRLSERAQGFENSIRGIAEDQSGKILVANHAGGLVFLDPATGRHETLRHDPRNINSLSFGNLTCLYIDRDGIVWVGTEGGGLNLYDPTTKKFVHYRNDPANPSSISGDWLYSIWQDRTGQMWVGTSNGLNRFNGNGSFHRFNFQLDSPESLSNNFVSSIYEDRKGRMWVGTHDGLNLLDRATGIFRSVKNDPAVPASLSDNAVYSIYETTTGQILFGTYGGGVSVFSDRAQQFANYIEEPSDPNSLSGRTGWSVYRDQSGRLWMGTNKGLNLFVPHPSAFDPHGFKKSAPTWIQHSPIICIAEYGVNQFLVGTTQEIFIVHSKGYKIERLPDPPGIPSTVLRKNTRAFFEDLQGNLWIGTRDGLYVLDRARNTLRSYSNEPGNPESLGHNIINGIREDSQGGIWVATEDGLSRFEPKANTFKNYKHNPNDSTTLSAQQVYSIHEDRQGRLWVGTSGGLNLFMPGTGTFRAIHYGSGVPNDFFFSILEDGKGRLWSSTNTGMLCFTPVENFNPDEGRWGRFKNYTMKHGLQNSEFSSGAFFQDKDGWIYLGGINGFSVFHPDSIREDQIVPPVIPTDLEIFNKPVLPGKNHNGFVMPAAISETKQLELSYREAVFTIRYSALAFAEVDQIQYAYQLEGFDKEWNYTDAKRRLATYTNLDPGTYTFRVKASSPDGIWNEEGATIKIIITPPWWKTWWFRTILAISSLGVVALIFIARTRSIRNTNRLLTDTVEQKTKELKEKNQVLVEQEREILAQNEELLTQTTALEEKNEALERAKGLLEIELQYQYQRELLKMSIDIQEIERKRIAQDLHDELGAVLSIARMQLVYMQNNIDTPALLKGLQQAQTMTETALATMRRISHELMPPQLEKYGLIKTLEALAGQINATKKISISLNTPEGLPRWSMPLELGLYRIVMEMINNTLRHAAASHIHIQLLQTLQNVVFTYSDDGKGLSKKYTEGHGFKNIEARTNALGGTIEIGKEGIKGFNATIYMPQTFFEPKTSAFKISSEDHAK